MGSSPQHATSDGRWPAAIQRARLEPAKGPQLCASCEVELAAVVMLSLDSKGYNTPIQSWSMHGKPQDSYLAACRRVLLETVGVGLYFVMRPRRRAHGMCLLFMLLVWSVIQQCARVTWLLSIGLGCLSFAIHHPDLVLKIGLYILRERASGASSGHGGRSEPLSPLRIQGAWATWCLPVVITSLLVVPLALCVIAYHVTRIIGFGALAVAHCVTQTIGFGALAVVDSILLALVRPLVVCIDLATPFVTATTRHLVATLARLVDTLDRRANWVTKLSEPALITLVNALHRAYVGTKKRRPTYDMASACASSPSAPGSAAPSSSACAPPASARAPSARASPTLPALPPPTPSPSVQTPEPLLQQVPPDARNIQWPDEHTEELLMELPPPRPTPLPPASGSAAPSPSTRAPSPPARVPSSSIWRALQPVTASTWLKRLVKIHNTVVMILGDDDSSGPYIRRATAVYAHIAATVLTAVTARALRLTSRAIWRAEGVTLSIGLAIACWLRRAHDHLVETACILSGRLTPAWHVFDSLLVAAYMRSSKVVHLRPLWALALLPLVRTAGDKAKRVPTFSGERIDFTAWFMLFSAYVAYKLVSAAPLVAGKRPKPPAAPAPLTGRPAPEPACAACAN